VNKNLVWFLTLISALLAFSIAATLTQRLRRGSMPTSTRKCRERGCAMPSKPASVVTRW